MLRSKEQMFKKEPIPDTNLSISLSGKKFTKGQLTQYIFVVSVAVWVIWNFPSSIAYIVECDFGTNGSAI